MKTELIIGIDPGTITGIAIWNIAKQKLESVESMPIHKAMQKIADIYSYSFQGAILVIFEDARLRKWFGNAGREKLMGAGSIRRDSAIWADFLKDEHIPFRAIAPKNVLTKLNAEKFSRITGWQEQTNQHGRDAAMMCFGILFWEIAETAHLERTGVKGELPTDKSIGF